LLARTSVEHGEHEKIHVAEEAVVAAFVPHVADGVDVDEEADTGNDQNHDAGKRIEKETPVGHKPDGVPAGHLHRTGCEPFEHDLLGDAMFGVRSEQLKHRARRVDEGHKTLPTHSTLTPVFGRRLPKKSISAAVAKGNSGISQR